MEGHNLDETLEEGFATIFGIPRNLLLSHDYDKDALSFVLEDNQGKTSAICWIYGAEMHNQIPFFPLEINHIYSFIEDLTKRDISVRVIGNYDESESFEVDFLQTLPYLSDSAGRLRRDMRKLFP